MDLASQAPEQELVDLFASFGAVLEPALLADLAKQPDGPVRAQAVLSSLAEVPFYLDGPLWRNLEETHREDAEPPEPVQPSTEQSAARKAALKAAAAAIYDGKAPVKDVDADDEAVDDHDTLTMDGEERAAVDAKQFTVRPRGDWRPIAAQHASQIEIVSDMTGNSTCEGTTSDFVSYFNDRYDKISRMLRQRRELRNAMDVERVRGGLAEVAIIGMVVDVRTTKNGHKFLEIEDPTGAINCLVNKNEEQLLTYADTLVTDEVIGVVGQAGPKGDMIFLESILRPDIPRPDMGEKKGADAPVMAAFLSDIHVGSNTFLDEHWKRMLAWLNGEGTNKREREAAGRVKYLVIPGDLVDGVGIYPGQQDELTIGDIYDQYGAFGDWMQNVPEHIEMIVQPGNHDASRPAEPQPAFSSDVKERFGHHGAHFLANPSYWKMHGVSTLGYHGSSLIDFATSVTNLEYEKPLPAMKQMLECRHLAPLYGERTPVAPEHNDYLVIDTVPDLFVTGHVHVPGIENYRGVQMINCGTWQSQTSYQKMLNFTPEPAKMPLIDLQTLRGTLVDFQRPQTAGGMEEQQVAA